MPKKSKSGPPYTAIPKEVYVVVVFPWGMDRSPRNRAQEDFNRVAGWAQLVLQQLHGGRLVTVECIYSMGTRDEIIIQFAEDTDIIPLLGEHRWAHFVKVWQGKPDDHRSTRVFLYNWQNNGDPANHNWRENYPRPVPLDDVPVKSPYPTPSWTSPPPSLTNFVLPIPRPVNPPPEPDRARVSDEEKCTITPTIATSSASAPSDPEDQRDSDSQPTARDSVSTNLFKPYEAPSHAQFVSRQRNQNQTNDPSMSNALLPPLPPPPKFIKKLDPYELEEDALSILRAPDPVQEDVKYPKYEELEPVLTLSIKVEDAETKVKDEPHLGLGPCLAPQELPPASQGYEPSTELAAHINALLQGVNTTASPSAPGSLAMSPQDLPPASLTYKPSSELEAYITAHLQGMVTTPSVSASGSVAVKREYEQDLASTHVEGKRIKVEDI